MNILELDSYRLGDAVKFNDSLNPRLWGSNEQLHPKIRDGLLKIADDFREFLGITDIELKDITISGSNAAYTYTQHSDIDLHLVVDLPAADASEVYRELFDAKKYQYNDQHNITIGGYDVELYVQNANQPHISQGIYSVLNNEWISVPRRARPQVDDISTRGKYETLNQQIEQAIKSQDYEMITALVNKIKKMRQAGLEQHGEFGAENLAFKMLRSQGAIEQLYAARNSAKDQLLSLDERKKKKKGARKKSWGYFGGYWYPGTGYAGQDSPAAQAADGGGDGGGESIREDVKPRDEDILRAFIDFCVKELKIKNIPTVKLRKDPEWPKRHKTFGRYSNDEKQLEVAWGNRHIMDVLRTVAHELTHKRQHEREHVPPSAGETGSEYENEANARAGVLMRDWARLHPEHFEAGQAHGLEESASGYIPTKRQAKDPRYSTALTVDIRPGQVGKEANKLKLKTDSQGHPQIARPSGLVEALALEFARFKADEDYSPDHPPGPESKPAMPKGTVRVDVSDVYDWYKLGQHVSNMKGLGKHDFGKGPPSSIISFGDEDTEHKFIDNLKKTGLDVTDIDPVDPAQPPGMKRVKTDPTYDVDEDLTEDQQLDEVKMSPSALMQWAKSPEAQGIRAGFEAELIFRDTTNDDDDDTDMEPDYDYDERARSVQGVIDFFQGGDYGGLSQREENRLQEGLDQQYMEWMDERMYDAWRDERDDLIKEAWLREKPMVERVHDMLVDGMDMDDREADRIQAVGDAAPRFTKSSDQEAYKQANPDYAIYLEAEEGAEEILQEEVEQTIEKEDGFYDEVLDEFRENFYTDDDSGFFQDVGLGYMSDIAAEYSLDWPYLTGGGGGNNGGSREWDEIGSSLEQTVGMPVKVSTGYHNAKRKEGQWIVEPDSSLSPDDSEDFGLEIVSPPMPLLQALEQLQAVTDWANSPYGSAYTNDSTGLHMGVSVPYKGGDVDYLKLILFLGDEYVLQSFGREANTYTKSAMQKFRENIKSGRADPAGALMLMKNNLIEFAQREIQKGVGTGKYTSAHIQDGYIEFRSAGGDWLAEGDAEPGKLENTMLRYARAMQIAANPSEERREYAKKLYKLIAPEGDSQLALFSQFAAGEIDKDQLKKQWAEKTIGAERKMNQRWKLFQFDKIAGEFTPVPGAEWNGYTEDQVKNAVWSKYGREALDSGEYELRNMSAEQQWEVYDVNTGETLEIVKGRNKGEAADAVFDKYAAQKIGFNVRPYEDPATMTPRAKLAKRITSQPRKPLDYNYEIVNQADVRLPVVDKFYATNDADAQKVYSRWLISKDLPDDTADYGYRKAAAKPAEAEPSVAQNFAEPQDATDVPRNWEFVNRINGQVIHNMSNASYNQATVVQDNLELRYPDADIFLRSVERPTR